MKNIILVILLLCLILLGYFGFFYSKVDSLGLVKVNSIELDFDENLDIPILEANQIDDTEENLTLYEINKALILEKKNIDNLEPDIEESKDIWSQAIISDVEKEFSSKEGVSPIGAIRLPKNSIKKLNIGDTVTLPNIGNNKFEAKITKKKIHKSGSVTIFGNLIDSEKGYGIILTEGKNMSFGTIITPNGSFEVETQNGVGYIYSTNDIDMSYIDHTKTDIIIPHIDKLKKIY